MTPLPRRRPCDNHRVCAGWAVIVRWSITRGKVAALCFKCDQRQP